MIEHQVRSYPELDVDELANPALPGTTTGAERMETWDIS
jgi:hypothetical protein